MKDKIKRTEVLTVKFSQEEMKRIDRSWKSTDHIMNRSQFVRAVVNSYTEKAESTD